MWEGEKTTRVNYALKSTNRRRCRRMAYTYTDQKEPRLKWGQLMSSCRSTNFRLNLSEAGDLLCLSQSDSYVVWIDGGQEGREGGSEGAEVDRFDDQGLPCLGYSSGWARNVAGVLGRSRPMLLLPGSPRFLFWLEIRAAPLQLASQSDQGGEEEEEAAAAAAAAVEERKGRHGVGLVGGGTSAGDHRGDALRNGQRSVLHPQSRPWPCNPLSLSVSVSPFLCGIPPSYSHVVINSLSWVELIGSAA